MKPRLLELVDKTSAVESVCAEKYPWLMRWALHFCGANKEMAEDLVQDTFVRMISSWETIRDAENPEKFLYTYLKYGFLRLRNTDRQQCFQTIDDGFDLLDMSVPSAGPALLEWQEEIRAVVDFLCSRKATAKSASSLLFRYFHGMFPAEIMLIARLSRKAVDDSLASSKMEAKAYVSQRSSQRPDTVTRLPRKVPQLITWPSRAVPSTEEFMRRMLQVVYAAGDGDCLSRTALCERYSERSGRAIDTWLLSHIVSCARCLDIVIELLDLPTRGSRPLDDVLGYAPKAEGKATRSQMSQVSAAMRPMAVAKERYRAAMEHRPQSITVIANGGTVASRDVSSAFNKLTVDIKDRDHVELIEVVSEHSTLFALPLFILPSHDAPVQEFKALLAGGRSITLSVEFNPIGIRLHVIYRDPLFLESLLAEMRSTSMPLPVHDADNRMGDVAKPTVPERLRSWLRGPFGRSLQFATVFASLGLILPLAIRLTRPKPAAVLAQAIDAIAKRPVTGIQEQRIRFVTPEESFERTLHTDLAKKLRSRQATTPANQIKVEEKLGAAHLEWNDPLSPAGFRDWRTEQQDVSDTSVEQTGQLLTVTTKVLTGAVREESLTLNAATFHAVGRTVRFSDEEEIKIAELDYSIVPLSKSDPSWFETTDANTKTSPLKPLRLSSREQRVQTPTPGELDVAELSVRMAMVELGADGHERLAINRRGVDILIEGLVATNERKLEIERRLRLVSHTSTLIRTFAEFDARAAAGEVPASVATSTATEGSSPLDAIALERHLTAAGVSAIHASLLQAAIELRRNATELAHLDAHFPTGSQTEESSTLRTRLAQLYIARLGAAAAKEQDALSSLGEPAGQTVANRSQPVPDLALANAQLCFELISQQDGTFRPAQSILRDLAASAAVLLRAGGPPPAS